MLFFYRMCVERVLFELCSAMLGVRTYSNVVMFGLEKIRTPKTSFSLLLFFQKPCLGGVILY